MVKPFKSSHPPALFFSHASGKKFVVGGSKWIEVPVDFTKEDIPKVMIWEGIKKKRVELKIYSVVSGSNPDITYKVKLDPSRLVWTCDCPGFIYRRKKSCKHIKQVQENR